ncbi:unnamed protein product [Fraxinus pennsylvanica]|uniref:Uncharacterized protein n=1 Tax=Fraxinus pennsylvanica TaxID=56036 RepID=A0AAD2E0R7_9LAMI|nr:unnamed protein product [Fraxinus pennsylvanica]
MLAVVKTLTGYGNLEGQFNSPKTTSPELRELLTRSEYVILKSLCYGIIGREIHKAVSGVSNTKTEFVQPPHSRRGEINERVFSGVGGIKGCWGVKFGKEKGIGKGEESGKSGP